MYGDGANMNAHARPGEARRPRLRRHAHQPAQDLQPARTAAAAPAPAPSSSSNTSSPFPRPRRPDSVEHPTSNTTASPSADDAHLPPTLPNTASAASAPSTATSASSCAPTLTSALSAPTACAAISEAAVLNANYIQARLRDAYDARARPHLHARGALQRPKQKSTGREDARHRQAPDRLRLPPADHLLPARRR